MRPKSRWRSRLRPIAWRVRRLRPGARWLVYCRDDLRGRKLAAITFDDGPSRWTSQLLDLFERHEARATFFVLGAAVDGNEAVLQRIVAGGNEIGNHTFSHRDPLTISDEELRGEIERTNARISEAAGVVPRVMRPPYGGDRRRVSRVARELGLITVLRSVDPEDWRTPSGETIANIVLEHVEPGAIVCLHDGLPPGTEPLRPSVESTVDAVARLIPALQDQGYELLTASQLLTAPR